MGCIWGGRRILSVGAVMLALSACADLLTVEDPQRYTSEDLDSALPAVANGAEGQFHREVDELVIFQALLSDVFQSSGGWNHWDDMDHGRYEYGIYPREFVTEALYQARWFAEDAAVRLERVLEGAASSSPMLAQVHLTDAMLDLYIGMAFCEAPSEPSGPAVTDVGILTQAVAKFTKAIATAQAAGAPHFGLAAIAGRARAKLLLADYAGAASDAAQVPSGFSYDAIFNQGLDGSNDIFELATKTSNSAGSIMYPMWDRIDMSVSPGLMRDPWTDEPDPRMPVFFNGELASDGSTPHYSQWKYTSRTAPIPLVHSDAMRLIEAEAAMDAGDDVGALVILNTLRANEGLTALAPPSGGVTMLDYLLSERFAELFLEGMRAADLHRLGLVDDVFGALNDPERPATGRPTKFPMSAYEASLNPQIVDDTAVRCLPRS